VVLALSLLSDNHSSGKVIRVSTGIDEDEAKREPGTARATSN
jgi:hypothetical protein